MTYKSALDISYIIPFRNWGLNRLKLATATALESFGDYSGEVIVSDYGSSLSDQEKEQYRLTLEGLGARYLRIESPGKWSRSRALNAGFSIANGGVFVASDADMLVPPHCLERAARYIKNDSLLTVFFTCLDLPQGWSDEKIVMDQIDWCRLEAIAHKRPRWGMGLSAVSREAFESIRGWDERFLTYGREDNDFSKRLRRAGFKILWPDDPNMAMIHMWHPSSATMHSLSMVDRNQIMQNKKITASDPSSIRNISDWKYPLQRSRPLVSVVVATRNHSEYLKNAIHSILAQTMQDFEIIVIDDGSTDDTRQVVESFQDSRLKYLFQLPKGISVSRNRGSDIARGTYIAVLEDDALSLPWRLEVQLECMNEGTAATFGSFVSFENSTGEMSLHRGKEMSVETASASGEAPGHSTWMVRADIMKRVRYNEDLTSGVDSDLALRLLRSGVQWKHSGRVLTLRRLHTSQSTVTDGGSQAFSATNAYNFLVFGADAETLEQVRGATMETAWPEVREASNIAGTIGPFLPDHLVVREIPYTLLPKRTGDDCKGVEIHLRNGKISYLPIKPSITWGDLASLRGTAATEVVTANFLSDRIGTIADGTDRIQSLYEVEAILFRSEGRRWRIGDDIMLVSELSSQGANREAPEFLIRSGIDGRDALALRTSVHEVSKPVPSFWESGARVMSVSTISETIRQEWTRMVGGNTR